MRPKVYRDVNTERELAVNIKSISEKGFTSLNMNDLYYKSLFFNKIEDDLMVKSIEATYLNIDSNWRVYSDFYGLQVFQWNIIEGDFCFTFFKLNEEYCFSQFCCVTNNKGRIRSINSFGTTRGDVS